MRVIVAVLKAILAPLGKGTRTEETNQPSADDQRFKDWTTQALDKEVVNVWKEAVTQLRRLSDDVWNSLKFFLTFNSILIGAGVTIAKLQESIPDGARILAVLAGVGIMITRTARSIMEKQRDYYSRMLLKKSLIEEHLGFYDVHLSGVDMSFVWGMTRNHLREAKENPEKWILEHRRTHDTVTKRFFQIHDGLMWIYVTVFCVCVVLASFECLLEAMRRICG